MPSKTQEAALLRIAQIDEILKKAFDNEGSLYNWESEFEMGQEEIDKLVQIHNLSKDLSKNFEEYFVHLIYQKAIEKKDFKWATEFAAKYKL